MSLWNLCSDSEGALTRWPLFSDRTPDELPWDVARVCDNRRWRNTVSQRIAMEREYPEPTPRTRANASGFSAWTKWIEEERKVSHEPNYEKPAERFALVVPEAALMFDHKIFRLYGELCWYHTKHVRAYRYADLHVIGEGKAPPKREKQNTLEEAGVFG